MKEKDKIQVAVIIKHSFRGNDYRVDIYEVDRDDTDEKISKYVYSQMLGPFEVVAISRRISYDNKIKTKINEKINNII